MTFYFQLHAKIFFIIFKTRSCWNEIEKWEFEYHRHNIKNSKIIRGT